MEAAEVFERRGDVEILDVREPQEWQAGHIDGARHLPMGQVPAHLGELPRDRTIVAVCRSGSRSDSVAQFLRANGFAAENLEGGLKKWASAGFEIVADGGRTGRVA